MAKKYPKIKDEKVLELWRAFEKKTNKNDNLDKELLRLELFVDGSGSVSLYGNRLFGFDTIDEGVEKIKEIQ